MPFGNITNEMWGAIAPYLANRTVWDLGAGDLSHAKTMLKLGAKNIVAIDKDLSVSETNPRIILKKEYFANVTPPLDGIGTAFVCWPQNYINRGLLDILEMSNVVIYIGSNTDGSACAWPGFFKHLLKRELLAHIPRKENSLLIVGRSSQEPRAETPEEYAALSSRVQSFADLLLR